MKLTLTLTDSQVARLRELDRVVAPGWEPYQENLEVIIDLAFKAGLAAMEERWQPELRALKEKRDSSLQSQTALID